MREMYTEFLRWEVDLGWEGAACKGHCVVTLAFSILCVPEVNAASVEYQLCAVKDISQCPLSLLSLLLLSLQAYHLFYQGDTGLVLHS